MKRALPGLLLMVAALPAFAAPSVPVGGDDSAVFAHPADAATIKAALGPVTTTLAAAKSISGPYTQDKYLHELPKPLQSSGDFLFVRDLGVAWRTVKPFASELIITHDALIQREGGGTAVRVDAGEQPAIRMVARIFFAVFSLDFEQLSQLFDLSVLADGHGGWQLGLKPKQNAGVIAAIVVSGHRDVDSVHLLETGGDRTEIEFHDAVLSTAPADAAQRARFR